MNIILLSGGSGKRLWPLSNDKISKQFLKLLTHEGKPESMVQRVARQIRAAHPDANLMVSCNHAQEDMILAQLGAVEIVAEPARRDTFAAIGLIAAHLHYVRGLQPSDSFIVCPIDVYAESEYFDMLGDMFELCKAGDSSIVLMGAHPTYESEKYGYILQKGGRVTGFVEKPSAERAGVLIADGALWNCGVFAMKIGYMLAHVRKHISFSSYEEFLTRFFDIPKTSFDYAVVENETSISAISYAGMWKDLGTWNTLTEEMASTTVGSKVIVTDDCRDTHVLNMLDIPIIVQDTSNTVVVASFDGLLVTSKPGSVAIKPIAEEINELSMYESYSWGSVRVVDRSAGGVVRRIQVDPGQVGVRENNEEAHVCLVIQEGSGTFDESGSFNYKPLSVFEIAPGAKYFLRADTATVGMEVGIGSRIPKPAAGRYSDNAIKRE